MLMTGAALSWIGLLQLDRVRDAFAEAANGRSLGDLPEITPSEAGKPQTIMLLGTDGRLGADAGSGSRSDTIILVRMDPRAEAITLMSIPRDFKAEINGYPDKINAAYATGGAGLTLKTVKDLLSRPDEPFKINHVVEVNFVGFRDIVNYFGCAYVDIDRDYYNDITGPGGFAAIDVNEGYQQVCGNNALAYVRYRHTDSDIVRGARQQDFMRQLLRSPGVRKKLSIGNVESLARLAGKYTTTDKALLESDTAAISLFKLMLGVADKPVQQVPFGAGRIADDAGYLVASQDAINDTLDQFMNPKTVTEEEATEPKPKPEPEPDGKKKKKKNRDPSLPAGLTSFADTGKAMAITNQRRLKFPFYYPELGASTASFGEDAPRRYTIPVGKREYQSYRLYFSLGPAGEYYGVQGTMWKEPPILEGPHDTVENNGKELDVYYDGSKVRLVAYRTKKAVYWVSNTLTRDIDKARMVAIAGSLARIGG